jgi:hypothetical protein
MRVAALLLVARLGLAASRLIRRAANAAPRGVLDHQACLGICLGKRYCARERAAPTGQARIHSGDMKKPCFSLGSGGVAAWK